MKTKKIYEINFDTEDTIMSATLSKSDEIVMLMSSGNVTRFNLDNRAGEHLFSVKSGISYPDGGFDIAAKTSIYTLDGIVLVVNDFKTHGFVHYPGKYYALHLWRKDYYADISNYPIALYKNADGIPHLIFGEAWNHVQIMNLDSRQVLTAAKSLIEENAEASHIEFYKKYSEDNKLPWPQPYDYFFGKLLLSPNQQQFLSAGWIWGSCDSYRVYDIDKFISSSRISDVRIGDWEHENRATCWIDDETMAVAYHPFTEGDENSTVDAPCEIHVYKINGEDATIERKIQLAEKNITGSKMYFSKELNSFIIVYKEAEVSIISWDGQTLFCDETLKPNEYDAETGCFLKAANKTITVYKIAQ